MAAPPEVEEPLEYPLWGKTWVLKVSIHCEGCKRKVKRILHDIEGVYAIDVEKKLHKVTVIGNVDANTLIRKLEKSGKHAELWPDQYNNCGRRDQLYNEDNSNQQQEDGPREQENPNSGGEGPPPSGPRQSDQMPPSPGGPGPGPHPRSVQFVNSAGGNPHAQVQTRQVRFDGGRPDNIPHPAGHSEHPPHVGQGGGGLGGAPAPNGDGGGGAKKKKKKKKRSNSNNAVGGANTLNPTNDNAGGGGGGPPPNVAPHPEPITVLQNPVHGPPPSQNEGPPPEHLVNPMGPQPGGPPPPRNHHQVYDYPPPGPPPGPPPSHCAPHYPPPGPLPPMYTASYSTTYPSSAYTSSYYAAPPPDSFAYVHQAGDMEHVILPSDWNGPQAPQPSNTFEIFSDENPNACSVM